MIIKTIIKQPLPFPYLLHLLRCILQGVLSKDEVRYLSAATWSETTSPVHRKAARTLTKQQRGSSDAKKVNVVHKQEVIQCKKWIKMKLVLMMVFWLGMFNFIHSEEPLCSFVGVWAVFLSGTKVRIVLHFQISFYCIFRFSQKLY